MFSELKNITEETGLSFSDERTALCGEMRGFGVIVYDESDKYRAEIFCERPFDREKEIFPIISGLAGSLPKNTIVSQSCETGQVRVVLEKYNLVQEKIVCLVEFLDKLTSELQALGLVGNNYKFPIVRRSDDKPDKGLVRIKLGFDGRSMLGLFGALIGGMAMMIITIFLVNVKAEVNAFGLAFEASAYIFSALITAVVFADYRFIARKLDACGVISCPVISLAAVILSGIGAGVRACGQVAGVSFISALKDFPKYLAENEEIDKFVMGFVTRGVILSVLASVGLCFFYFSRHPEETMVSEKIIDPDSDEGSILPRKRR